MPAAVTLRPPFVFGSIGIIRLLCVQVNSTQAAAVASAPNADHWTAALCDILGTGVRHSTGTSRYRHAACGTVPRRRSSQEAEERRQSPDQQCSVSSETSQES